jgi:glycosyltransferase involved in cell wall biosynthesis
MLKSTKVCRKQCTVCAILRRKARTGAGLVSKFIAISKYIAGVHQRAWCWLPDIAVIGNPIEPVIPSAVIENSPKVRFGYIGRLVESKGVREAIEAFRSAGIESDFMIAGKGNPKYIEECRAKAVNAAVSFSGYKAPPDFFSAIDVLVVPSIWPEAFGRVVIEAASAGIPSIVSDRGGLPELVDERKTGWVYSRSSELIGLFREVSRHPLDLRAMESDCRASAERFHPERIVESIEGELLKLGRNV